MHNGSESLEPQPPRLEWRTYQGHDWLLVDPHESHMAGISIAYGELDEPVEDMGVLRYLAAALRAELVRPVETGPGRVGFPDVQVSAAPSNLDILIGGDLGVVAGAMRRLEEFFSRPELPDELPDEAGDEEAGYHDQAEDLVLRFGANSWTMRQPGVKQDDVRTKARSLLARLDPATSSRAHVLIADDVLLIGCAFMAPPRGKAGGPRSVTPSEIIHRISEDPRQRCGTVPSAERMHDLMTAVTANSFVGSCALHLMVEFLEKVFAGLIRGTPGLPHDLTGEEELQFVQLLLGRTILFRVSSQTHIAGDWLTEIHHRISRLPRVVSDGQVRHAIERARASISGKYRGLFIAYNHVLK